MQTAILSRTAKPPQFFPAHLMRADNARQVAEIVN
jgi:hypothetical protein